MEPLTSTAIAALLTYWGGKAFDKVFDTTADEFTKDSIKWLKSIFFKDNKAKEITEKFEDRPESLPRQDAMKAAIYTELEENPEAQKYLQAIAKTIEARQSGNITISNSTNVNTGTIKADGNVIFGNDNLLSNDHRK